MSDKEARFQAQAKRLRALQERDLQKLLKKEREYDRSWQNEGGLSAYFNIKRKWDRFYNAVKSRGYDAFLAIKMDPREEGILDDIRDLRNYLLLVEEEVMHQGLIPDIPPKASKEKSKPSCDYCEEPAVYLMNNGSSVCRAHISAPFKGRKSGLFRPVTKEDTGGILMMAKPVGGGGVSGEAKVPNTAEGIGGERAKRMLGDRDHPFGYDPEMDNPPDWTCIVCGNVYSVADEDQRHRDKDGSSICGACKEGMNIYG